MGPQRTDPLAELLRLGREALLDAWALVQPVDCYGCGAPDRACCDRCRAALGQLAAPVRVRCDADPGAPVWCAADYAGAVRGAILALKEQGRLDAARPLAPLLRAAVGAALDGPRAAPVRRADAALIPSSPRALARRGYAPLRVIATRARLPDARVLAVRHGWRAGSQKHRGRADRLAIGPLRFRSRGSLAGRAFLIIDDVATTGSTLRAATAAIREAGGEVLGCAVVAAPDLARRRLAGRS